MVDDKSKSYIEITTIYDINGISSLKDLKQNDFEEYMSKLLNNKIIIDSFTNSKINGMNIIYCTYADNIFKRLTVIYENGSLHHILSYKSMGEEANFDFVDTIFTLTK
jgi:hypothetical protein